jgi:hypothetical protein
MNWERAIPPSGLEHVEHWKSDTGAAVFVAREGDRWHMSIAHPKRLPTWPEVHEARYRFLPEQMVVGMLLPPKADYVNKHQYCFHLWEIQGEEAYSHAPSLRRIVVP